MLHIKRKLTEIESVECTASVETAGSGSNEGDDDAFFFPRKKQSSSGLLQLEEYLSSQSTETSSITTWPLLKDLFMKTNTALPASAACERLFSAAGRIFTPLRARISDQNFENQFLLKLNKSFLQNQP